MKFNISLYKKNVQCGIIFVLQMPGEKFQCTQSKGKLSVSVSIYAKYIKRFLLECDHPILCQ